jgi:Cu/Ag efflux pump CusA
VLLTSLTTFLGLLPLLLERSMQAKFMIPMAVSLAFGVVFATVITLVLVPVSYVILQDVRLLLGSSGGDDEEAPEAAFQEASAYNRST